jgi:signal transduction histidine kinase
VLWVACVAVAYYAAARLGLALDLGDTNASPVWPPSGIGFAAVLHVGYRVWPGISVGAFLANIHTLPQTSAGFAASLGICVGNTVEHIAGVYLLRRMVPIGSPFQNARDVFCFVLAAAVGCFIASTNGALTLWSWGIIPAGILDQVWFTWWLGDTAGVLVLAPMIYAWSRPLSSLSRARRLELAGLLALTALGAELLFGGWLASWIEVEGSSEVLRSLPYLVVPSLLWAAFRFGPRETATAAVVVSAVAIWHTWDMMELGRGGASAAGPFVSPSVSANTSLLMLQVFVCAISVTAAALAAAVAERNRSNDELREINLTLEQRVADRTAELAKANTDLARSNQELDDFAYIASHDLKEPLRGIHTYSSFLIEDHGSQLDAEAHSKLDTVQRLTKRMEALIESLLSYSRVGRVDLAVEETDLNEILRDVLDSIHITMKERGVELRIPRPLPKIVCDRVRVAEVFRNLVTNAMKYNDKPQKWIEVGFRDAPAGTAALRTSAPPDSMVYYVRDNGIGIAEKHIDTVFRIFKRLHGRDKFGGGSGAGLTIVKKIVERHGGRIWVESVVDEGSTFCFTLGSQSAPSP